MHAEGTVDATGKIADGLRTALKERTLALSAQYAAVANAASALLMKLAGQLETRNADNRETIRLNRQVYLGDDLKALWHGVKHKTTYRLDFDAAALVADAAVRLAGALRVAQAQLRWRQACLAIGRGGVDTQNATASGFVTVAPEDVVVRDVLGELQNLTQLTRASLARIVVDSGRLGDLKLNRPRSSIRRRP